MTLHDRVVVLGVPTHEDPGEKFVLESIEHPGFDDDGKPTSESRTVYCAGPDGHSALNLETGVTAVWVPGEIVAQWAVDLEVDSDSDVEPESE